MTTSEALIRSALEDIAALPVHLERLQDRHTIIDAAGMWVADARSGTAGALVTVLNELPQLLHTHDRAQQLRREAIAKASDRAGEVFRLRRLLADRERELDQARLDLTNARATIDTLTAQGGHA